MSEDREDSSWTASKLQQDTRMTYVEDQACNLPKIERASVNTPSTPPASNERIEHG